MTENEDSINPTLDSEDQISNHPLALRPMFQNVAVVPIRSKIQLSKQRRSTRIDAMQEANNNIHIHKTIEEVKQRPDGCGPKEVIRPLVNQRAKTETEREV